MLHVRRDRWLPGAHPNQVQPTLLQIRRTQNLQTKAPEMKTKLLPTASQVCRRLLDRELCCRPEGLSVIFGYLAV
ncbi:hypothetical protein NQZ68_002099 [Dissostichus eleginoides]|nr:hypothetical protein NQZ68_002099 [Dissostichus eleginoides]